MKKIKKTHQSALKATKVVPGDLKIFSKMKNDSPKCFLWLESWRTSFSCTSLKVISPREAAVSKHCKCRSQMNRSILLPLCWSDSNGFYFELHACQGNSSPQKVPSVGKRPGAAERSLTFSPRNWDVFRPSPSAQSSTTWRTRPGASQPRPKLTLVVLCDSFCFLLHLYRRMNNETLS